MSDTLQDSPSSRMDKMEDDDINEPISETVENTEEENHTDEEKEKNEAPEETNKMEDDVAEDEVEDEEEEEEEGEEEEEKKTKRRTPPKQQKKINQERKCKKKLKLEIERKQPNYINIEEEEGEIEEDDLLLASPKMMITEKKTTTIKKSSSGNSYMDEMEHSNSGSGISERGTTITAISEYQKQKNFASILDNLCKIGLEAVIVISDRGVILRANPTALQLTEYLQDELINHKINKLLPKYYRERHDGYLLRYTRTLCPVILNRVREGYHLVRKARFVGEKEEDRKIPVALKTTEIVDQNGQRYFVGVLRDDRIYQYNRIHSDIVQRMYPASIYQQVMKKDGRVIHGRDNLTCVFVDLVGFSSYCKTLSTEKVVVMLNDFFEVMDKAVAGKGRFIKTIGDCYMYVCGLQCCEPDVRIKHVDHAAMAIDIGMEALVALKEANFPLQVRIGVCAGTAIFGVFGSSIPTFDVFGDVVNIASRMEKIATPNRVTVFSNVKALTSYFYNFEERFVKIKGFPGEHQVFDVLSRKDPNSIYSIAL